MEYKPKTSEDDSRVPFVVTYGSNLPNTQDILHKRMAIMNRSTRMREIFNKPPITAFRRDANIGDILVHAKHM